jgi:transcriptional regulator of acetoin/glycerol metabolism
MECAATPVTDGAGRVTGVIDLTCAAGNFRPMLLAGVSAAAAGGGGMAFSVIVSWR